jgi:hypothetical protein
VPYMQSLMLDANTFFGPAGPFDGPALAAQLGDASTVADGVERLGLVEVYRERLGASHAAALVDFLSTLPPSLDRALVAGLRSALERGLRTQFTWRPGAAFELQTWETATQEGDEWVGLVNILLVSPEPPEPVSG